MGVFLDPVTPLLYTTAIAGGPMETSDLSHHILSRYNADYGV